MAFGWAGAGAGAAKSLEQLVTDQRLRQALEAEIQMRQQGQQEQQRSNLADEGMRGRSLDMQEQALNAPKPVPRDPIADHLAIKQIDQDMAPPPTPKRYPVTTPGPNGQPLSRLASEDEMTQGVPVYQKPEAGPKPETPEQVWVTRNGTLTPIRKGSAQAGDQPYDAVAARPNPNTPDPAKARDVLLKIRDTATKLKNSPGLARLTGNRVLNPDYNLGISDEPRPGSLAADAQPYYDTLKSLLTLENLGLLKGAMSDKDLLFLQSAGSSLQTRMSDPKFMEELDGVLARADMQLSGMAPAASHGAGPAPAAGADPLGLGNLPRRPK